MQQNPDLFHKRAEVGEGMYALSDHFRLHQGAIRETLSDDVDVLHCSPQELEEWRRKSDDMNDILDVFGTIKTTTIHWLCYFQL